MESSDIYNGYFNSGLIMAFCVFADARDSGKGNDWSNNCLKTVCETCLKLLEPSDTS